MWLGAYLAGAVVALATISYYDGKTAGKHELFLLTPFACLFWPIAIPAWLVVLAAAKCNAIFYELGERHGGHGEKDSQ